jgi:hypothetical protein
MDKTALDPFRVIVGVIASRQDSDLLVDLVSATGLRFDPSLSNADAYSNKTRLRALRPRIIAARDELEDSAGLGVASTLVRALGVDESLLAIATESLRRVGWDIQDGELVAVDPDVREMFFPKGSRWDAFVALRGLIAEAANSLTIVDGYCDSTVFQLLAARADRLLSVRILCWKSAAAVSGEAKTFCAQHTGWDIEVRQAQDFHDRFIVLDGDRCVHIGASINGAGKTAFMVSRVEDIGNRGALLKAIEDSWTASARV